MALRQALAITLGVALAIPPSAPAAESGLLRGTVTRVDGSRVSDADVDLVNLDDGKLTRLRTDGDGAFEASLEVGSYKVELQNKYVVVRGPRMVTVAAGNTMPAELVVANPQGAARSDAIAAAANPNRAGNVAALSLFSSALAGVAIYAATRGPDTRPSPPSNSTPTR